MHDVLHPRDDGRSDTLSFDDIQYFEISLHGFAVFMTNMNIRKYIRTWILRLCICSQSVHPTSPNDVWFWWIWWVHVISRNSRRFAGDFGKEKNIPRLKISVHARVFFRICLRRTRGLWGEMIFFPIVILPFKIILRGIKMTMLFNPFASQF